MLDISSILRGVVDDLPIAGIFAAGALAFDFIGYYVCSWIGCDKTGFAAMMDANKNDPIPAFIHYFVVLLGALCLRRIFPDLFRFNL